MAIQEQAMKRSPARVMGRNQATLLAKKEGLAWKETTKRGSSQLT